jgi:uncharacterized membrane-anchored protein YjiN (DUF445 family)
MMETDIKAKQLKKHKQLATGLFVLMLVLFVVSTVLMRRYDNLFLGYLKAFTEAAMVGALADWFAVTALFHYPLGIKIPHTNLIENSKASIGDNLGSFVVNNFLTAGNIRPYINKITVSEYAAQWLAKDRNKQLLVTEITRLLNDIVGKMDDASVSNFLVNQGKKLIDAIAVHKLAANALQYFLDNKEQDQLITLVAAKIKEFIAANEKMVQERVKKESPFFIPGFVDKKLAEKISTGLVGYFDEIENDPTHRVREEIAIQLYQFINSLRTEAKWEAQLSTLKQKVLSNEKLDQYAADVWQSLKTNLQQELSSSESALKRYLLKSIDEFANSLQNDPVLQQKIDGWIRHTAYRYILKNADQVGSLISNTVGNWQGRELSQKLELEVGKDLQFIRINGTIVGGLIGLLIYTLDTLLR